MKNNIICAIGCLAVVAIGLYVISLRADIRHLKAAAQDDAELICSYRLAIEDMNDVVGVYVNYIIAITDRKWEKP